MFYCKMAFKKDLESNAILLFSFPANMLKLLLLGSLLIHVYLEHDVAKLHCLADKRHPQIFEPGFLYPFNYSKVI